MLRVVSCLTTQHDWRLIVLAGAVCFLTSVAAIHLFRRAVATGHRTRLLWLLTTGVAAGYGIWATHFVGMLAFSPGLPSGYDPILTLSSLVSAVVITTAGFALAATAQGRMAAPLGGGIVGLGVAAMHFTGMAALKLPAEVIWALDLVVSSVLLGIAFAMGAVTVATRFRGGYTNVLSAALLALAILGLHFTAMGAVTIVPDPTVAIPVSALLLSPQSLSVAIASAAVAVLGISLAAAIAANAREALIEASNAEIASHAERLETALRHIPQGLCMFDQDQRVVVANRRYADIYRLDPEDVRPGKTLLEVLEARRARGIYADLDMETFIAEGMIHFHEEMSTIHQLDDGRFISVQRRPTGDGGLVSTHEDITERHRLHSQVEHQNLLLKEHEQLLHLHNIQLDAALNNIPQGLCMFDAAQQLVVCNKPYMTMYGLSPEQASPGTPLRDIISFRITKGLHAGKDPEADLRDRLAPISSATDQLHELTDGRVIAISRRPMPGGGWVSTHEDVTERRGAEDRIAHLAHHDALTGLPNRVLLRERLEKAIAAMRDGGRRLAVLLLDLDRFKEVNDSLGHPVGDALLKAVTKRLLDCVRPDDTIARLGGDEFAIVQRTASPATDSVILAKRIQAALDAPFDVDGHHVLVGTSIGIALAPGDGDDPDELLRNADLALYRAKSDRGGSYHLFEPELDQRMQARRSMEMDLRDALMHGGFVIHYQPLLNLERAEICGFEALLRWKHPTRGNVPPAEFIPLAEETGLIVALGEWVLRQACSEAATWPDDLKIAINISPMQFRARNLAELVIRTLAATGMPPRRLELEITETAMMQDEDAAVLILNRLHDIGVRLALDDFGTGYSSLSNLRKFPFDKLKIDRSFIRDLSKTNRDALAVLRTIAQLGANLGMVTTAEGVETEEQLEIVRAEACTEVQGYLVSQPFPAADIERLLLKGGRKSVSAA